VRIEKEKGKTRRRKTGSETNISFVRSAVPVAGTGQAASAGVREVQVQVPPTKALKASVMLVDGENDGP